MIYKGAEYSAVEIAQDIFSMEPIFFDTETTGVGNDDEVVEIAVVDKNGSVLLDSLVKPTKAIPQGATKIHGITNEEVATAPAFDQLWQAGLQGIFEAHPLCIYNAAFDMRIMQQTLALYGIQFTHNPLVLCVMHLFSEYAGIRDEVRGTYKWHKLVKAAAMCDIESEDLLHRALADSELTRRLLQHLSQQLF